VLVQGGQLYWGIPFSKASLSHPMSLLKTCVGRWNEVDRERKKSKSCLQKKSFLILQQNRKSTLRAKNFLQDELLTFLRIFWRVNTFAEKLKTLENSRCSINLKKNVRAYGIKTFLLAIFPFLCQWWYLDSDSWPYTGETRKKMNFWCLQGFFGGSTHLPKNWKLLLFHQLKKTGMAYVIKTFLLVIFPFLYQWWYLDSYS